MILRTPAEHENREIFLDTVLSVQSSFPRTRESRFDLRELAWIPAGVYPERGRRAGMTVPSGPFVLLGAQNFQRRQRLND